MDGFRSRKNTVNCSGFPMKPNVHCRLLRVTHSQSFQTTRTRNARHCHRSSPKPSLTPRLSCTTARWRPHHDGSTSYLSGECADYGNARHRVFAPHLKIISSCRVRTFHSGRRTLSGCDFSRHYNRAVSKKRNIHSGRKRTKPVLIALRVETTCAMATCSICGTV